MYFLIIQKEACLSYAELTGTNAQVKKGAAFIQNL